MPRHEKPKNKWPTWKEAETFPEWVIRMIETKKTKEPEFQAALNYWGRPKIEKIWKEHLEKEGRKKKE